MSTNHADIDIKGKLQTSFKPEGTRGMIVIEWGLKKISGKDWETLEPIELIEFTIGWGNKDVWSRGKDELPEDLHGLVPFVDAYHLNGMNAGTKKQTEAVDKHIKETEGRYDYSDACVYLESIDLFIDQGYKYGHGWLVNPMPRYIAEQIDEYLPGFLEAFDSLS